MRSAWDTNVVAMTDEQLDALAAQVKHRDRAVSAIASPIGKVDIATATLGAGRVRGRVLHHRHDPADRDSSCATGLPAGAGLTMPLGQEE